MLEFLLSNLKGKDRALRRFAILSVSQNHMSPVLFSAQALPGIIPEGKASENAKKPAEARVSVLSVSGMSGMAFMRV